MAGLLYFSSSVIKNLLFSIFSIVIPHSDLQQSTDLSSAGCFSITVMEKAQGECLDRRKNSAVLSYRFDVWFLVVSILSGVDLKRKLC